MFILHCARIEELRTSKALKLAMADIAHTSDLLDLEASFKQQAADYEAEIQAIMRREEAR